MSNLFLTLVIAFVVIVLALACLAIGWLVTGKPKNKRGVHTVDSAKFKTEGCDTTCHTCSTPLNSAIESDQSHLIREEVNEELNGPVQPAHFTEQEKFPSDK